MLELYIQEGESVTLLEGVVGITGAPGYNALVEGGEVELSMDPALVESEPYMMTKFEAVINGGEIPQEYSFTGPDHPGSGQKTYVYGSIGYGKFGISSLSGARPVDGTVALLTDACTQIGLFQTRPGVGGNPGEGRGEELPTHPYGVHIMDTCLPCVDCADYEKIEEYIRVLQSSMDRLATRFMALPSEVWEPGADKNMDPYGLFRQQQALTHYWNYLSYQTSIKFDMSINTSRYPAWLTIITSHRNASEGNITPFCSITVRKFSGGSWSTVGVSSYRSSRFYPVSKYIGGVPPSGSSPTLPPHLTWEVKVDMPVGEVTIGDIFEATVRWSNTCFGGVSEQKRKEYVFRTVEAPVS